jgi:hypothetical protein
MTSGFSSLLPLSSRQLSCPCEWPPLVSSQIPLFCWAWEEGLDLLKKLSWSWCVIYVAGGGSSGYVYSSRSLYHRIIRNWIRLSRHYELSGRYRHEPCPFGGDSFHLSLPLELCPVSIKVLPGSCSYQFHQYLALARCLSRALRYHANCFTSQIWVCCSNGSESSQSLRSKLDQPSV